jgi:acid phosphatase type 7
MRGVEQLAVAVVLAGLAAPAAATPTVRATIGPYVQDLRSDGFTVVFETATEVDAEVAAGGARVATHGTHHEAVMRGLGAASRVAYDVRAGEQRLGGGSVVLPGADRPLTFVVYGDSREGGADAVRIAALAASLQPDLVLHTGDLVAHGSHVGAWREFFAGAAPLVANVPLYPALGNHEVYKDRDAVQFRHFFALPDGGRERLYYQFRVGPAQFVVLDGNHPTPAQTAWLGETLEAARRAAVPHVFILVHAPPFSVGDHCGAARIQAEWVALFERYRVRAVFAGHDHAYERLERHGVRYFVSGGGGAPVYQERPSCAPFDHAAKRVYRPVHHLLRVRVDATTAEVTALASDGAPRETTFARVGEPMFAMDAPPLVPERSTPPWTLAGAGAVMFLLLGIFLRRRLR